MEANPGTVNKALLKNLYSAGVNRISLGAQSFNDNELKALGRIHTSKEIFESEENHAFSMHGLSELLVGRKETQPEGSYTTYLFQKGIDKILKKVGEECTEVIIAGKADDKKETVYEIADLAYHVMVLMVEMGITVEDIQKELASRHVIDHKVKQEKMTK